MKMKIKFYIISISSSICLCLLISKNFKRKEILNYGIKTKIIETGKIYNGNDLSNFYFNYYFITNDGIKIPITHFINRKQLKTGISMYRNKFVIYSPNNPNEYVTQSEISDSYFLYYMVFLNLIFYLILSFCFNFISSLARHEVRK